MAVILMFHSFVRGNDSRFNVPFIVRGNDSHFNVPFICERQ